MYTASRTVFSEGLVAVELDGKWGFIDMAGKTIIPFRYDLAKNFKDGFAEVILNNAIIYIDRQGNTIK